MALAALAARAADFRDAVIVADSSTEKAARMITEEIEKRTQLRVKIVAEASTGNVIRFAKGSGPAEGFALTRRGQTVTIAGNDARGMIFGAGRLLRSLDMARQHLEVPDDLNITSAPKVPIRGHQLGYRPKTNAYDGWNVPMWEQYIRELAIFGTNTIELIPPRSDDADDSPHFALPKIEMMAEMSRIANEYGMSVSIWYPAMDRDYSDPKTVEFALKEWGDVFRQLPRVDAVFVPGGDPGHTQPKYLLALLEKQTGNLHRYHPEAGMWVSPQSFNKDWMDEFIGLVERQPAWLTGVVYGPQVRGSMADLRKRVPARYPIRFYPDITHSLHAEFPVPDWDFAFATTEGREGINPRPVDEAAIFRAHLPFFRGFVTYSEGCNDDVNKFVWSALGWDPDADVAAILRDYSRFFIGDEKFAQGLAALERNWRGPLAENTGVDATLHEFQAMEKSATPRQKLNWRFQEGLYRAYYDAYVRSRLITETRQEEAAMRELAEAKQKGSTAAMDAAERTLAADARTAEARDWRVRVFELAEALFQSIHMQLSVPRYGAIALGRGANLDAIDFALNNRVWLGERFREIRGMNSEADRLAKIENIVHWTDPGPGGFYDDLRGGFGGGTPQQGWRTSWYTDAETLYDEPLRKRYEGLDPNASYKVRVVYGGDALRVPIRLVANGSIEIHGFRAKDPKLTPAEFEILREATHAGTLTLEWTSPPGLGGSGRGTQVSEVWLRKQ